MKDLSETSPASGAFSSVGVGGIGGVDIAPPSSRRALTPSSPFGGSSGGAAVVSNNTTMTMMTRPSRGSNGREATTAAAAVVGVHRARGANSPPPPPPTVTTALPNHNAQPAALPQQQRSATPPPSGLDGMPSSNSFSPTPSLPSPSSVASISSGRLIVASGSVARGAAAAVPSSSSCSSSSLSSPSPVSSRRYQHIYQQQRSLSPLTGVGTAANDPSTTVASGFNHMRAVPHPSSVMPSPPPPYGGPLFAPSSLPTAGVLPRQPDAPMRVTVGTAAAIITGSSTSTAPNPFAPSGAGAGMGMTSPPLPRPAPVGGIGGGFLSMRVVVGSGGGLLLQQQQAAPLAWRPSPPRRSGGVRGTSSSLRSHTAQTATHMSSAGCCAALPTPSSSAAVAAAALHERAHHQPEEDLLLRCGGNDISEFLRLVATVPSPSSTTTEASSSSTGGGSAPQSAMNTFDSAHSPTADGGEGDVEHCSAAVANATTAAEHQTSSAAVAAVSSGFPAATSPRISDDGTVTCPSTPSSAWSRPPPNVVSTAELKNAPSPPSPSAAAPPSPRSAPAASSLTNALSAPQEHQLEQIPCIHAGPTVRVGFPSLASLTTKGAAVRPHPHPCAHPASSATGISAAASAVAWASNAANGGSGARTSHSGGSSGGNGDGGNSVSSPPVSVGIPLSSRYQQHSGSHSHSSPKPLAVVVGAAVPPPHGLPTTYAVAVRGGDNSQRMATAAAAVAVSAPSPASANAKKCSTVVRPQVSISGTTATATPSSNSNSTPSASLSATLTTVHTRVKGALLRAITAAINEELRQQKAAKKQRLREGRLSAGPAGADKKDKGGSAEDEETSASSSDTDIHTTLPNAAAATTTSGPTAPNHRTHRVVTVPIALVDLSRVEGLSLPYHHRPSAAAGSDRAGGGLDGAPPPPTVLSNVLSISEAILAELTTPPAATASVLSHTSSASSQQQQQAAADYAAVKKALNAYVKTLAYSRGSGSNRHSGMGTHKAGRAGSSAVTNDGDDCSAEDGECITDDPPNGLGASAASSTSECSQPTASASSSSSSQTPSGSESSLPPSLPSPLSLQAAPSHASRTAGPQPQPAAAAVAFCFEVVGYSLSNNPFITRDAFEGFLRAIADGQRGGIGGEGSSRSALAPPTPAAATREGTSAAAAASSLPCARVTSSPSPPPLFTTIVRPIAHTLRLLELFDIGSGNQIAAAVAEAEASSNGERGAADGEGSGGGAHPPSTDGSHSHAGSKRRSATNRSDTRARRSGQGTAQFGGYVVSNNTAVAAVSSGGGPAQQPLHLTLALPPPAVTDATMPLLRRILRGCVPNNNKHFHPRDAANHCHQHHQHDDDWDEEAIAQHQCSSPPSPSCYTSSSSSSMVGISHLKMGDNSLVTAKGIRWLLMGGGEGEVVEPLVPSGGNRHNDGLLRQQQSSTIMAMQSIPNSNMYWPAGLELLHLGGCSGLGDDGIVALAEAMLLCCPQHQQPCTASPTPTPPSAACGFRLQSLQLRGIGFGPRGVDALGVAVEALCADEGGQASLLSESDERIGRADTPSDAFTPHPSLELSSPTALSSSSSTRGFVFPLRDLQVRENPLGPLGVALLARRVLAHCPLLRVLDAASVIPINPSSISTYISTDAAGGGGGGGTLSLSRSDQIISPRWILACGSEAPLHELMVGIGNGSSADAAGGGGAGGGSSSAAASPQPLIVECHAAFAEMIDTVHRTAISRLPDGGEATMGWTMANDVIATAATSAAQATEEEEEDEEAAEEDEGNDSRNAAAALLATSAELIAPQTTPTANTNTTVVISRLRELDISGNFIGGFGLVAPPVLLAGGAPPPPSPPMVALRRLMGVCTIATATTLIEVPTNVPSSAHHHRRIAHGMSTTNTTTTTSVVISSLAILSLSNANLSPRDVAEVFLGIAEPLAVAGNKAATAEGRLKSNNGASEGHAGNNAICSLSSAVACRCSPSQQQPPNSHNGTRQDGRARYFPSPLHHLFLSNNPLGDWRCNDDDDGGNNYDEDNSGVHHDAAAAISPLAASLSSCSSYFHHGMMMGDTAADASTSASAVSTFSISVGSLRPSPCGLMPMQLLPPLPLPPLPPSYAESVHHHQHQHQGRRSPLSPAALPFAPPSSSSVPSHHHPSSSSLYFPSAHHSSSSTTASYFSSSSSRRPSPSSSLPFRASITAALRSVSCRLSVLVMSSCSLGPADMRAVFAALTPTASSAASPTSATHHPCKISPSASDSDVIISNEQKRLLDAGGEAPTAPRPLRLLRSPPPLLHQPATSSSGSLSSVLPSSVAVTRSGNAGTNGHAKDAGYNVEEAHHCDPYAAVVHQTAAGASASSIIARACIGGAFWGHDDDDGQCHRNSHAHERRHDHDRCTLAGHGNAKEEEVERPWQGGEEGEDNLFADLTIPPAAAVNSGRGDCPFVPLLPPTAAGDDGLLLVVGGGNVNVVVEREGDHSGVGDMLPPFNANSLSPLATSSDDEGQEEDVDVARRRLTRGRGSSCDDDHSAEQRLTQMFTLGVIADGDDADEVGGRGGCLSTIYQKVGGRAAATAATTERSSVADWAVISNASSSSRRPSPTLSFSTAAVPPTITAPTDLEPNPSVTIDGDQEGAADEDDGYRYCRCRCCALRLPLSVTTFVPLSIHTLRHLAVNNNNGTDACAEALGAMLRVASAPAVTSTTATATANTSSTSSSSSASSSSLAPVAAAVPHSSSSPSSYAYPFFRALGITKLEVQDNSIASYAAMERTIILGGLAGGGGAAGGVRGDGAAMVTRGASPSSIPPSSSVATTRGVDVARTAVGVALSSLAASRRVPPPSHSSSPPVAVLATTTIRLFRFGGQHPMRANVSDPHLRNLVAALVGDGGAGEGRRGGGKPRKS